MLFMNSLIVHNDMKFFGFREFSQNFLQKFLNPFWVFWLFSIDFA